jgi:hypothetical protein
MLLVSDQICIKGGSTTSLNRRNLNKNHIVLGHLATDKPHTSTKMFPPPFDVFGDNLNAILRRSFVSIVPL